MQVLTLILTVSFALAMLRTDGNLTRLVGLAGLLVCLGAYSMLLRHALYYSHFSMYFEASPQSCEPSEVMRKIGKGADRPKTTRMQMATWARYFRFTTPSVD